MCFPPAPGPSGGSAWCRQRPFVFLFSFSLPIRPSAFWYHLAGTLKFLASSTGVFGRRCFWLLFPGSPPPDPYQPFIDAVSTIFPFGGWRAYLFFSPPAWGAVRVVIPPLVRPWTPFFRIPFPAFKFCRFGLLWNSALHSPEL